MPPVPPCASRRVGEEAASSAVTICSANDWSWPDAAVATFGRTKTEPESTV
jgi:hypothetical protein